MRDHSVQTGDQSENGSPGETTIALQELLSGLEKGEHLQLIKDQLISRAYLRLRFIARRMLGTFNRNQIDEETDGLVAEAYLRLNQSLDDLRPETVRQFFGLAAMQMRRHLLDKLRAIRGRGVKKRPAVQSMSSFADEDRESNFGLPTPNDGSPWESIDILEALEQLGERERECLIMQHWFGFTHPEIAKLLDVSTKTVQRSTNLAFLQLNDLLKSYRSHRDDSTSTTGQDE